MTTIIALTLMTLNEQPAQDRFVKLEPIPFTNVQIRDRFWQPRQEVNRTATVEHSLAMLEKAGNFFDLQLAKEGKREGFRGLLFTDSDLYKVLEGIAYTLATHPDPALDERMDEIIALIADVQEEDGYVNTWFQVTRPDQKWTNLRDWHEIYCAGHMIEAAVAHHLATGKRNFLDVALKFADLINDRYGPQGGLGYGGHPEIELALVKLWKATGDRKWFDLSAQMINTRGSEFFMAEHGTPAEQYDGTYWMDDVPICDTEDIEGHAVRAAYLMSGAADVARETEDPELVKMLRRVWRSATDRRVYITGGIGPSNRNEGFTVDYDLPNLTAYQETCASIAMALWGHRMALLYGDAKYMDAVERSLYNGVLSGVALDGRSFFYVNPLASMGDHQRSEWFACACCPPNVLRTIASIGGYAYATSDDSLYVNLFIGGSVTTTVGGKKVVMDVETDYPWDGKVKFTMKEPGAFKLRVRRPGWCVDDRSPEATVDSTLNMTVSATPSTMTEEKGYLVFEANWKKGDWVLLNFPMPVVQMEAHPYVKDDVGRAVIQRGPIVYCAEQADNSVQVDELIVPRGTRFSAVYRADVLNGVVVVTADAQAVQTVDWDRKLYQPIKLAETVEATFIPYGFWANRGRNKMVTWMPTSQPPARILGPEAKAEISMSFVNSNCQPWGINDGIEPESSGQQPKALAHTWPHKGGEEWFQYTWDREMAVTGIAIYWFDDTGRGEIRLPESWKLQAMQNGEWKDVPLEVAPIALDEWCEVAFDKVTTTSLRIVVKQQDRWATGIHEWKVVVSQDD